MSSSGLNWEPLLQVWLNKRGPPQTTVIKSLFSSVVPALYTWCSQELHFKIAVIEINIITQVRLS